VLALGFGFTIKSNEEMAKQEELLFKALT